MNIPNKETFILSPELENIIDMESIIGTDNNKILCKLIFLDGKEFSKCSFFKFSLKSISLLIEPKETFDFIKNSKIIFHTLKKIILSKSTEEVVIDVYQPQLEVEYMTNDCFILRINFK